MAHVYVALTSPEPFKGTVCSCSDPQHWLLGTQSVPLKPASSTAARGCAVLCKSGVCWGHEATHRYALLGYVLWCANQGYGDCMEQLTGVRCKGM
jgi:hypothetical protein